MNNRSELVKYPLYFLHIPKTAGTTFTEILDRQFAPDKICPAQLYHDILRIDSKQLAAYHCFRGHFYAYFEKFLKMPLQTITFLRDPIERTLSHYAHIYHAPGHYFYKRLHEQDSFLTFLQDPSTNSLVLNFQARSLAIELDPAAIAATLSFEELNTLKLEHILATTLPYKLSDDELLKRAKDKLDQCLFVGLTEKFDQSIEYISNLLRWNNIPKNLRLNITQDRPKQHEISPEAKALIMEQTYLDYELYAYACARFKQCYLGASLKKLD